MPGRNIAYFLLYAFSAALVWRQSIDEPSSSSKTTNLHTRGLILLCLASIHSSTMSSPHKNLYTAIHNHQILTLNQQVLAWQDTCQIKNSCHFILQIISDPFPLVNAIVSSQLLRSLASISNIRLFAKPSRYPPKQPHQLISLLISYTQELFRHWHFSKSLIFLNGYV